MNERGLFRPNTYGYIAEKDILNAKAAIQAKIGTPRAGIFWCEQAIEKYFKHIITDHSGGKFATGYDLLVLAKEAGYDVSQEERLLLPKLSEVCCGLYPTDDEEPLDHPTWEDADTALETALRIQKWAAMRYQGRKDDSQ